MEHDDGLATGKSLKVNEIAQGLLEQMKAVDEGQRKARYTQDLSHIMGLKKTVAGHLKNMDLGRDSGIQGNRINCDAQTLLKGRAQGVSLPNADLDVRFRTKDFVDPAQYGVVVRTGQSYCGLLQMDAEQIVVILHRRNNHPSTIATMQAARQRKGMRFTRTARG